VFQKLQTLKKKEDLANECSQKNLKAIRGEPRNRRKLERMGIRKEEDWYRYSMRLWENVEKIARNWIRYI